MSNDWGSRDMEQYSPDKISEQILAQLDGGLGKSLRQMKATFDEARRELKLANPDKQRLSRMNVEVLEAAQQDLAGLVAKERSIVETTLEAERKKFERDSELNLDKYSKLAQNYERRAAALSTKELEQEAHTVLSGMKQLRPEQLDILSASLKQSDPKLFETFREEVAKQDLYSAWKHTPGGSSIVKYLEMVKAAEQQGGAVPVKTPDGNCYNVTLDQALGGTLEAGL
jgi:phytoene dehydrogenase-like protein